MTVSKRATKQGWTDPDDAPVLTDAFFEQADEYRGHKVVKRGRPPKAAPKVAVKLRLDPDLLEVLRATGPGWQTRANRILRERFAM
jgi:uncharacterized protein (DUF4415 family)